MSERNRNDLPPHHALRLGDLRAWHVVTAWCVACDRKVVLSHKLLRRGRTPQTRIVELQGRLRCIHCGAGDGHRIDIAMAPRNT